MESSLNEDAIKALTIPVCTRNHDRVFRDVMVDVETFGLDPKSVVPCFAAVAFNAYTGQVEGEWFSHLRIDHQLAHDRTVSADTLLWWFAKDQDAARPYIAEQAKIYDGVWNSPDLVLQAFSRWIDPDYDICDNDPRCDVHLWGNGSDFDLPILTSLYMDFVGEPSWKFWNNRDMRTIKALGGDGKKANTYVHFKGVKHYPLDDCRHQVEVLTKCFQNILG